MGTTKRATKPPAPKTQRPRRPTELDVKPKVFHAFKQAKKAADKAKTFEIQKLVKRLKTARSEKAKPDAKADIPALEAQLQALKELSNDYIGHVALVSKIRKDKILSANEDVTTALSAFAAPAAPDAKSRDEEVVRSRVLSSKHLSSALQDALAALHSSTGHPISSNSTSAAAAGHSKADGDASHAASNGVDDDEALRSDDASHDEDVAMRDDVVLDEADEDVDADGWESGSVADELDDNEQSSPADSESDARDDVDARTPSAHALKPAPKGAQASSSLFLPSLAVGFTRGDSDSDWSDGEAKVADGVRKNRRGQRARQAIWEKKYGRGAKHVQKRQQLDARAAAYAGVRGRGAGASSRGSRGRGTGSTRGGRGGPGHVHPATAHAQAVPPKPAKPTQPEKPTHPSWEAKQKQKAAVAIQPSQATKIKFQ